MYGALLLQSGFTVPQLQVCVIKTTTQKTPANSLVAHENVCNFGRKMHRFRRSLEPWYYSQDFSSVLWVQLPPSFTLSFVSFGLHCLFQCFSIVVHLIQWLGEMGADAKRLDTHCNLLRVGGDVLCAFSSLPLLDACILPKHISTHCSCTIWVAAHIASGKGVILAPYLLFCPSFHKASILPDAVTTAAMTQSYKAKKREQNWRNFKKY